MLVKGAPCGYLSMLWLKLNHVSKRGPWCPIIETTGLAFEDRDNPRVTWWRHQMETFSVLLAICAGKSPVPVKSPHKGQWREALMFSFIYVRINGWVNAGEAGDLRRHLAHYDVIVIYSDLRGLGRCTDRSHNNARRIACSLESDLWCSL